MKQIKLSRIFIEVEVPFDIEHLKDLFENLTEEFGKVDFTDKDVLDYIDDNKYIFSDNEMKQLPQLYNQWYLDNDYFQCKEEVNNILDDLCEKYPNEDIESIINTYFS